eukprot:CAMPEP_0115100974 /NCGR_PEP_ID=MMETSP0227-20121206/32911_1 /TAXON_ID=89957 /ORGANISM="Polarella glacialis, Strain CCMP 1383" /LENGTH=416 /DNA_ID=CAMNT_0002496547 /DNA_START=81 /DNA_END=1332 /DNA_ORIENTATION=-
MAAEMEMGYWKIRGLGAVLRMVLEYKEAKYKEFQCATGDEWFGGRKPEILKKNPLANLPYIVDGDVCVCQTNAVMLYLGDKFDMNGSDEKAKLRNNELLCEIYDVRNGMLDVVYAFKKVNRTVEEFNESAAKLSDAPPFGKFEAVLEFYGGDWFVSPAGPCEVGRHRLPLLHLFLGHSSELLNLNQTMAAEMEMGYWKIRGLGAVLRMVLEYKEAKYKEFQCATGEEWFGGRKPDILKMNPLANLPYIVDGDVCVCQTNAVMLYLGDKFDMNGPDEKTKLRNNELLCEIYDVRNGVIELVYAFKKVNRTVEEFNESAAKLSEAPPFGKFEAMLDFYGGDWFVSPAGPCVADFHIWEMLDQHKMLAEKVGKEPVLDKFPKCKAFYDRFRALPTLQKYFASEAYKLPVNNPIANAYFQ